jgi:hypothetical protein
VRKIKVKALLHNPFTKFHNTDKNNVVHLKYSSLWPSADAKRGQTSPNRTKPGPSFQLKNWPFACCAVMVLSTKTCKLKVEN